MIKLIEYIRRYFCKHEFELKHNKIKFYFDEPVYYESSYYKCKKCGYIKKENKNVN